MVTVAKKTHGGKRNPPGGRPKGTKLPETLAREKARAAKIAEIGLTAQKVVEEIALVAFQNAQDYVGATGVVKGVHELTREEAAAVKEVQVVRKNVEAGDGHIDTVLTLRLHDKLKALETLADTFGLRKQKAEIQGNFTVSWMGV